MLVVSNRGLQIKGGLFLQDRQFALGLLKGQLRQLPFLFRIPDGEVELFGIELHNNVARFNRRTMLDRFFHEQTSCPCLGSVRQFGRFLGLDNPFQCDHHHQRTPFHFNRGGFRRGN